jgi:hypothetical protein
MRDLHAADDRLNYDIGVLPTAWAPNALLRTSSASTAVAVLRNPHPERSNATPRSRRRPIRTRACGLRDTNASPSSSNEIRERPPAARALSKHRNRRCRERVRLAALGIDDGSARVKPLDLLTCVQRQHGLTGGA